MIFFKFIIEAPQLIFENVIHEKADKNRVLMDFVTLKNGNVPTHIVIPIKSFISFQQYLIQP